MTAPTRIDQNTAVAVAPEPIQVRVVDKFHVHCRVFALLVDSGWLDLQQAVDLLQHDAVRNGVVDLIGQDAVQAIMASAFEKVRHQ